MLIDKQILFESADSETNYNYILYNDFYLACWIDLWQYWHIIQDEISVKKKEGGEFVLRVLK